MRQVFLWLGQENFRDNLILVANIRRMFRILRSVYNAKKKKKISVCLCVCLSVSMCRLQLPSRFLPKIGHKSFFKFQKLLLRVILEGLLFSSFFIYLMVVVIDFETQWVLLSQFKSILMWFVFSLRKCIKSPIVIVPAVIRAIPYRHYNTSMRVPVTITQLFDLQSGYKIDLVLYWALLKSIFGFRATDLSIAKTN